MTAIPISGATRLYGIVGNPIAQVKSPETFNAMFTAKQMDAVMLPVQVLPERFDAAITELKGLGNLDGLLVTVPYKARAVAHADRLGPTASRIRALNALRREADGTWTGDMFDGAGFVHAATGKGYRLQGRRVALFGAGGAGGAIACELAAAGVESLAFIDPQRERADALADTIRRAFPRCRAEATGSMPAATDMVVNASTVGMREGDGLPGAIGALEATTLVGDVIVSRQPTALIRLAIEHGCDHVSGNDMHRGQGDALLAFFRRG
jgi:shikimate dehydrogenase